MKSICQTQCRDILRLMRVLFLNRQKRLGNDLIPSLFISSGTSIY